MGFLKNFLNVARLHCCQIARLPKKFDLVHQTVSPRERVESGDETNFRPRADCPGGHPALEQNILGGIWSGGNLFTTAGPFTG